MRTPATLWVVLSCFLCRAQQPTAEPAAPLAIEGAAVMESEDGGAVRPGFRFHAGDTFFYGFRVTGYRTSENKVHVTYRVEVKDPAGVPIVETLSGKVQTELSAKDKEWTPRVRHYVALPQLGPPGEYTVHAHIRDEIGEKEASAVTPFSVIARVVEPSETLTIRNFRFSRTGEENEKLDPATYKSGDAVFARFDIIGYKYGEKNKYSVGYGIQVTVAEGKVILSDPKAAGEENESFYPRRYVPGEMQLKFQPDLPAGEYVLKIAVNDQIGGQNHTAEYKFIVQ